MIKKTSRSVIRKRRHTRIRRHIKGTASRPRLFVYRSLKHMYAQIIDDETGKTLLAASTLEKDVKENISNGANKEAAARLGELIAERALAKDIKKVVFDRGGYLYHGRIAALANAARQGGLEF